VSSSRRALKSSSLPSFVCESASQCSCKVFYGYPNTINRLTKVKMDAETVQSSDRSLHGSHIISMYLHHEIDAEDEKSLPTIPAHYLENQYRNRDPEASSVYSSDKEQGDGSISPPRKKLWQRLRSTRADKTSRRRIFLLCTSGCLILA
jgi:hypothetical protein